MRRRALLLVTLATACTKVPELPPPLPPAKVAASTTTAPPAPLPPRAPEVGPKGETARIEGRGVAITVDGETQRVEASALHPAPGDPSLLGITPTALLYLDDGTLLVGGSDGVVSALDGARKRLFSLGFRGAIRGLSPAGAGLFAVTTERGVMALVTGEGRLRWEREVTGERLGRAVVAGDGTALAGSARGVFAVARDGEMRFSHAASLIALEGPVVTIEGDEVLAEGERFRFDGPHPPVPSLTPTFPLTFRLVEHGRFGALQALGPDELLALVDYEVTEFNDWPGRPTQSLVRIAGGKTTRTALPHRTKDKDVFVSSGLPDYAKRDAPTRPDTAPVVSDALVMGPEGKPWVVGRRLSGDLTSGEDGYTGAWIGAGIVYEPDGKGVRERRDLHEAFAAHLGRGTQLGKVAAAPRGKADLFCFGHGEPVCALHEGPSIRLLPAPGRVVAVSRIGDEDWVLLEEGGLLQRRDDTLIVPAQAPHYPLVAVAGLGPRDVWGETAPIHMVLHFDGTDWSEVAVPTPAVGGFSPRAADDVWASNGKARWDGKRWSLVYGAPTARHVLARSRDDVWLAGDGLWHATAPGPTPVSVPVAPTDAGAIGAIAAATIGPAEARHGVERWSFPLKGEAPFAAAQRVSTSVDGAMWFRGWDRVIEVDSAGKATTLTRDATDGFTRSLFPEAAGRGLAIDGSMVRHLDRGKTRRGEAFLDERELVAIDGNGQGAVWAVGSSEAELRSPQALVRATSDGRFQPVLGLPSATWCDVAAAADGGAWLAGALSPGPAGEGILVHARGLAGSAGSRRHRAPSTLLAAAALGADEAWAVGAGGTILHVRGEVVTRYALASGEWLRAVHATGPDEAWIGGDGGTLLHFEGGAFHPVTHPLGANASVTGISAGADAIWAVSPSGILKITRRP